MGFVLGIHRPRPWGVLDDESKLGDTLVVFYTRHDLRVVAAPLAGQGAQCY